MGLSGLSKGLLSYIIMFVPELDVFKLLQVNRNIRDIVLKATPVKSLIEIFSRRRTQLIGDFVSEVLEELIHIIKFDEDDELRETKRKYLIHLHNFYFKTERDLIIDLAGKNLGEDPEFMKNFG